MKRRYLVFPLILQTSIWLITQILFSVFARWKIIGFHNLDSISTSRGIIFAANHSSELDPIVIPAALPFLSRFMPMFYTSREESFYQHLGWKRHISGGWFFKIWGAHALNPGKSDYSISLHTHIKLLQAGKSVCIFPEGRITKTGELQEGRGGIPFISYAYGTTVIPVYIGGMYGLSLKSFFSGKNRIVIVFGKPMTNAEIFEGVPFTDPNMYHNAAQNIMKRIASLKPQP
jgi:1-acyl-sn-glycerol-3-phosphate acyltransferase